MITERRFYDKLLVEASAAVLYSRNKPVKVLFLSLLSALLVTGCQTKLLHSEIVEFYKEGTTPTRPYERMKLLYTVNWSSAETDAMNYFTRKAEILGADAVIVLPHEDEGFKVYPFGKIGYKYKYKALAEIGRASCRERV